MRNFISRFFLFSIISLMLPFVVVANEKIPDDIRYSLEDMYGANKNEWPSPIYKTDLNKDGFNDWVAVKKGCTLKQNCPAEIFICLADEKGLCVEYCYIEVKTLKDIEKSVKKPKCQSTC